MQRSGEDSSRADKAFDAFESYCAELLDVGHGRQAARRESRNGERLTQLRMRLAVAP